MTHTHLGNGSFTPSQTFIRYVCIRADTSDPGLATAVESLAKRLAAEGQIQNADSSIKHGYGVALCGSSGNRRTVSLFANGHRRLEVREGAANLWRCDLVGHRDAILDLATSNDGRRLATASADGTVRLWDGTSGQEVLVLNIEAERLFFSPDDRWLCVLTGGCWRMLDSLRHREVLRRRVPAGG
ncbi:MAG: hypothetical protein JNK49_18555 [Planctomycetes bacterium]|nr:hypothetical protein [Planctomycetota bacterium]